MIPAIRSEFRKLLSVRSTYIVTLLGLLLIGFVNFYVQGMKAGDAVRFDEYIGAQALTSVNVMTIFIGIIALLIVTHEYRYNTITYTLTTSNSRTKSFLAKVIVVGIFSLVAALVVAFLAPLMAYWGASIAGLQIVPQQIYYADILWRCLFVSFGSAIAALIIAFIIRNQVGAIVTYFLVVNTIEGLLGLLLKQNTVYLPFSSLEQVANMTARSGVEASEGIGNLGYLSAPKAAMVFSIYMVVGLAVSWLLYLRRDAN